jgi:enoyl-CoA hydratase/carnithine racemase
VPSFSQPGVKLDGEGTDLSVEREQLGAVLVITLNRPEVGNSLNTAVGKGLLDAFRQVASDDSIRAVVLTGAGEKIFCGGMDLKALTAGEDMNTTPSSESPKPQWQGR